MNNSGAIYVAHSEVQAVAAVLRDYFAARGFVEAAYAPDQLSGRIFLAEKRRRHFLILAPANGWITIWEDPRYFADRLLARSLAQQLQTRSIWIEVSGNSVAWARGVYAGSNVLEEHFEESETTFYGQYGPLHFVFDLETSPDELIAQYGLPYDELHYEAALEQQLPPGIAMVHVCFERDAWPKPS